LIPDEVLAVFERVRNGAYAMPDWQLDEVLVSELGPNWQEKFETFERTPCAAASIGQVHRGRIYDTKGELIDVAIKVQYPGVATSISSDLAHLGKLLSLGDFLPKGLFLDNTLRVMQMELAWEVDYMREANWTRWFGEHLLLASQVFGSVRTYALQVPKYFGHLSTSRILTLSWLPGVPLSDAYNLSQSVRDRLGTTILALCIHEVFHLGVMQTDPNWANFLFDGQHIALLDFGATRQFNTETFLIPYRRLIHAAAANDMASCWHLSRQLGFLTGDESPRMRESHIASLLLLGAPFRTPIYDFAEHARITQEIKASIPIMLAERLCPPPDDAYALHRKLSGAFLLCARLRARIPCQAILEATVKTANR
jgi:aarF domain-containing kinase